MSTIGKFQVYYNKIYADVTKIHDEHSYINQSKAFAHWFLEKFEKANFDDISETIIDGDGDNGIDAIILVGETMRLYQFKFPDREKNIDKCIDETAVVKLNNGYQKLISTRKPRKANDNFLRFREIVKSKSIFNYEFIFVSYSNGLSAHAEDSLEQIISAIKESTGNAVKSETITKAKICDLLDKSQKKFAVDLQLKYIRLDPSYNVEKESSSWAGFANALDILSACKDVMDVIFDENIRLYEENAPVNNGIIATAASSDSKYFYFFHNGIVFICSKCANSAGNQTLKLASASVVNGCQTIVSLKRAKDRGALNNDIFIPIRIIETEDFDLRAKITEYLNSQSKIKDSYFLANNTFVKSLQDEFLAKGYFFERIANEYSYKLSLGSISEFAPEKILTLEKTIQIYVAFYNNEYAATAKRGKNDLFNRDIINELISTISADKVLTAYQYYQEIYDKIALFRKCRRAKNQNKAFLESLGYGDAEISNHYDDLMSKYIFVNTADMLLLNAFSNIKQNPNYSSVEDPEIIIHSIIICMQEIMGSPLTPSDATKNSTIFSTVQSICKGLSSDRSWLPN